MCINTYGSPKLRVENYNKEQRTDKLLYPHKCYSNGKTYEPWGTYYHGN